METPPPPSSIIGCEPSVALQKQRKLNLLREEEKNGDANIFQAIENKITTWHLTRTLPEPDVPQSEYPSSKSKWRVLTPVRAHAHCRVRRGRVSGDSDRPAFPDLKSTLTESGGLSAYAVWPTTTVGVGGYLGRFSHGCARLFCL